MAKPDTFPKIMRRLAVLRYRRRKAKTAATQAAEGKTGGRTATRRVKAVERNAAQKGITKRRKRRKRPSR